MFRSLLFFPDQLPTPKISPPSHLEYYIVLGAYREGEVEFCELAKIEAPGSVVSLITTTYT